MKQANSLRCAIYTRVSTDHGLDQEFNSLDNQREAAEAYIKSQAHEGWRGLRDRFDDGGFSGGSLDRPALQALLSAVQARRIDVVVVYKVDRLTRSLADFAKLVELFDANGVSFVSVTQAFNTTSSMGRLTLNVLLSFAQFEREVTGERIRDKIAASKRRGLWVGGNVPLGYRVIDKKLAVVEEEAERVRLIFRRYLELGSLGRLLLDLRQQGIMTALRPVSRGGSRGGIPFTRGSLAYLLRNRFYVGEIVFRGGTHRAEHPAILDREIFEAVQRKLTEQRNADPVRGGRSGALLIGKLVDDRGNRMTPTHACKGPVRYRYYISRALVEARGEDAGSVRRIAAPAIEQLVVEALRSRMPEDRRSDAELIGTELIRARVGPAEVSLALVAGETIAVPWSPNSQRRHRDLIQPPHDAGPTRTMRTETRNTLITSIARGRRWLHEIVSGAAKSPEAIAEREGCSKRQVNAMISLAHLAPEIVQAAIDGRLPYGIGVRDLTDPPAEWSKQRAMVGRSSTAP